MTLPHSLLAIYLRIYVSTPTPPPAATIPMAVVAVLALPKLAISAGAVRPSDTNPTGAPVPAVPAVTTIPAIATPIAPKATAHATGPTALIAITASPRLPSIMIWFSLFEIAVPSSFAVLIVVLIKILLSHYVIDFFRLIRSQKVSDSFCQ